MKLSQRIGCILFAASLVSSAPFAQSPAEPVVEFVPDDWLVVGGVDARGRRPFRPDAVLRQVLLEGRVPEEGASVEGESGKSKWKRAAPDSESGRLALERGGYAWTSFEAQSGRVVLARLNGASTLIVNGTPYAGDVYGYGFPGVPVTLAAGRNRVLVTGARGSFELAFRDPASPVLIGTWDCVVPDMPVGAPGVQVAGLLVVNASATRQAGLRVRGGGGQSAFQLVESSNFDLAPGEMLQVALELRPDGESEVFSSPGEAELPLEVLAQDESELARSAIAVPIRKPDGARRYTFVSHIDNSVQEYCVLPPGRPDAADDEQAESAPERLLLSLHGASVEAWNQVTSYGALPDFWIVAPTNRRPFGFDWQDWGRLDAYEVLDHALRQTGVDRRRVYLSGHSMGGHGTWHLGANDPDGFAALAPSAGWRSFDSYGGRPAGERSALWHAADAASNTEALLSNLVPQAIYVLHSDADESVPVEEARAMVELLRDAGADPGLHIEEGRGHWWDAGGEPGADCLHWPPFFELFRSVEIPDAPSSIAFATVSPGVDARHHWVRVEQVFDYGRPARFRGRWDSEGKTVHFEAENIRLMRLSGPAVGARRVLTEENGREVERNVVGDAAAGGEIRLVARRVEDADSGVIEIHWSAERVALETPLLTELARGVPFGEAHFATGRAKSSRSVGPLKRAFERSFALVVPTAGTPAENGAAFERARYDAQVWRYRGNGNAPLVRDSDLVADPVRFAGRNLILYGNADTNRAWAQVVPEDAPFDVRRDRVRLGEREWEGAELGLLVVYPRAGEPAAEAALVACLAATGPEANLLATTLAPFVSGVGYPDYVVFDAEVLSAGDGGVRAAGFFDSAWALAPETVPAASEPPR